MAAKVKDVNVVETHARSITKALSYRIFGSLATALIAYVFTHKTGTSLAIGLSDVVVKVIVYYVHERAWSHVPFGKTSKPQLAEN